MAQSAATLRIGTRGSPLALWQARTVRDRLAAVLGRDAATIEIRIIRTTGDTILDRPLAEEGGKGLFTKEIDEALFRGDIDLAVHSAKDVPTFLPHGLMIAACLEREDPRDALISIKAKSIKGLARGARIGTASLRRQAIVKRTRPDLEVAPLRGNVETRLRKLETGDADAIILAIAGLKRLGIESRATTVMSVEEFLPAAGQGAIAVEIREADAATRAALAQIDHADTSVAVACERAFLAALDGSCKTPIGAHAVIDGETVHFRGLIARPDGSEAHDTTAMGRRTDAAALGAECGHQLRKRAGPGFFD
ncbi:MAG: hydroxymethylbilane synthase [Hyphomicrobiales bacterium]|nr:hydroxymethylbilane synthase [Hyphomicrobiales bacterium]